MFPDKKIKCPYTGFTKTCLSIVSKQACPKWVHVMGSNPQTGEHIDKFACADSIQHLLLLENSQMQRQTAAAIESFRNEVAGRRPHSDMPALEPARTIDNGRRIS